MNNGNNDYIQMLLDKVNDLTAIVASQADTIKEVTEPVEKLSAENAS